MSLLNKIKLSKLKNKYYDTYYEKYYNYAKIKKDIENLKKVIKENNAINYGSASSLIKEFCRRVDYWLATHIDYELLSDIVAQFNLKHDDYRSGKIIFCEQYIYKDSIPQYKGLIPSNIDEFNDQELKEMHSAIKSSLSYKSNVVIEAEVKIAELNALLNDSIDELGEVKKEIRKEYFYEVYNLFESDVEREVNNDLSKEL